VDDEFEVEFFLEVELLVREDVVFFVEFDVVLETLDELETDPGIT
jgi:hypothetical protein